MKKDIGVILKGFIVNRAMTQRSFAEKIDLSATALSQIITSKTKPRQSTLTKIMNVLSLSEKEEQALLKAFENCSSLPEDRSSPVDPLRVYKENRERCYRYLEMKSRSIAFNNEIESLLKNAGVEYIKDYMYSNLVTDFYLPKHNIALECKFNISRDAEKTLTISKIIKENLKIPHLYLIIPMKNELNKDSLELFKQLDIRVMSIVDLVVELPELK